MRKAVFIIIIKWANKYRKKGVSLLLLGLEIQMRKGAQSKTVLLYSRDKKGAKWATAWGPQNLRAQDKLASITRVLLFIMRDFA